MKSISSFILLPSTSVMKTKENSVTLLIEEIYLTNISALNSRTAQKQCKKHYHQDTHVNSEETNG